MHTRVSSEPDACGLISRTVFFFVWGGGGGRGSGLRVLKVQSLGFGAVSALGFLGVEDQVLSGACLGLRFRVFVGFGRPAGLVDLGPLLFLRVSSCSVWLAA